MIALLDFLEEHGDAVEYDLIGLGLRLRDFPSSLLSWRDLIVIIRHSPPTSAVWRASNPHWQRTPEIDLLRMVEHGVRVLGWQNTKDATKGRNYPDPIALPWDAKPEPVFSGEPMDWDEAADWYGWRSEMDRYFDERA